MPPDPHHRSSHHFRAGHALSGAAAGFALVAVGIASLDGVPHHLAWFPAVAALVLAAVGVADLRDARHREQFDAAMSRYAVLHPIRPFRRQS